MTGKDLLLLLSTFFMGALAGAYLYVTAFAPSVENLLPNGAVDANSFVIEGKMYGSCEADNSCASFQLVDGRRYTYLPTADGAVQEGTLNVAYKRVLMGALTTKVLALNAQHRTQTQCASARGSIDYTYTITRDKKEYVLDTCITQLSSNTELQNTLTDIWFALENPDAEPAEIPLPSFKFQDAADFIFNRFHGNEE